MDKISKSWLLLGNILFLDIGWQSQLKELKHNLEKASRPSLGAKDGGRGWTHHRPSHQRGPYSGQCHHTSSCWGTHLVPAVPLPSQSMVPGAASFSKSSFRVLITIRVPKHRDTGDLLDTGFFGLDMMSIFLKGRSWLSEVGPLNHGFVYWGISCLLMTLIHRKPRIEKDGSCKRCGHGFVFWSFTTNKFFKVNKDNHLSNFR